MNALSRFRQKPSRLEERKRAITGTMTVFMYAMAIVLHDEYGFTARIQNVCNKIQNLILDYSEMYEPEYLETALRVKCKERGIGFK